MKTSLSIIYRSMGALFLVTFAGVWVATYGAIPEYIQVCKADDPKLAQCINESIDHLKPQLMQGIPELDVPPIEPLLLDEIQLRRGPSGSGINCNISDLKVWGPASFVITELKPNVPKSRFAFKVWLPQLYFVGKYDLDLKILMANVRGSGIIRGNFTDYTTEVFMRGNRLLKDGEEYLKFEKIRLKLNIGKTKLVLENLFQNDRVLSQISEDVIDGNTDLFIGEIKPTLETALADKFMDIANKITLKFSYKELFP